jgi:hypothetical protein
MALSEYQVRNDRLTAVKNYVRSQTFAQYTDVDAR